MFPASEKSRSEYTELPGHDKYIRANQLILGNLSLFSAHQSYGHRSLSSRTSLRYRLALTQSDFWFLLHLSVTLLLLVPRSSSRTFCVCFHNWMMTWISVLPEQLLHHCLTQYFSFKTTVIYGFHNVAAVISDDNMYFV